jgi:putative FmdB family regulatory protein
MPLYEYECLACGERSEVLQRFSDPPLAACPKCGGEVKKLVSAPGFQFKGTGWYATDYAGKKGESRSGGKAEGGGDAAKAGAADKGGESAGQSEAKAEAPAKPATTAAKD